jgi:hypothetical protein
MVTRLLTMAYAFVCVSAAATVTWTGPGSNGHAYEAVDTVLSWPDINSLAATRGGYVVTITSAAEQAFVFANFGGARRWIGLTDEATEGTFQWVTGEPVVYTNWDVGEPNNSNNGGASAGEDFSELRGNGTWNDIPAVLGGSPFLIQGVIEYDAVPEPASGVLVASAAIVAAIWRSRSRLSARRGC